MTPTPETTGEDPAVEEHLAGLDHELLSLAELIVDAFESLGTVDQSLFSPQGTIIDRLEPDKLTGLDEENWS